MFETLEEFAQAIDGFYALSPGEQCDYFVYYLTVFKKINGVRPKDIDACFDELKTPAYSNVPTYLRWNLKKRKGNAPKFIKQGELYHLERSTQKAMSENIVVDTPHLEVNKTLRSLSTHLSNKSEQVFFEEAVRCFEVQAYRSAIVMVWILTLDHIFEFILASKLKEFNSALSKVTDRRVKVSMITTKDDFSDIPESNFIEISRSAGVISNDVRKILVQKLDTRNSAAHPSNITVGKGRAYDFIEDLVNNVILKY